MRLTKWLAVALAICLAAGAALGALAEPEGVVSEKIEESVGEVGGELGLDLEGGEAPGEEPELAQPTEAPAEGVAYARARMKNAPVYMDTVSADLLASLRKGEVVLVTGEAEGLWTVAVNVEGTVYEGYMEKGDVKYVPEDETDACLDAIANGGSVALYKGDMAWPLPRLSAASVAHSAVLGNGNYTDLGNDTVFVLNGKKICANMVPDKGIGNCWAWAQEIYKMAWGVRFNSEFVGTGTTGLNMLKNLTDSERKLTPAHLKTFVQYAVPGATLRVCSCTSKCSSFDNDGLSCGHKGHSLIIVERRSDGVVTMDDHSGSQHTRFYSWEGFCNSWKNYTYVKYIKWPNAPQLPSTESIDGYEVRSCDETYRVRADATGGARVYSAPQNGKALATLAYPATFAAAKKTTKTYGGYSWVYGSTQANVTGWLPLNNDVVNVNDPVAVTGLALSHGKMILIVGGSATLTATVFPEDATDKTVAWTSSDSGVVSVSGGVLTGVGEGYATITATAKDGGRSASCEVRVVPAQGTKVLSSTGSNGTVKMLIGQRLQLVATFATRYGWKLAGVKSSNSACASVDTTGVVVARAAGQTVITVTTKNNKKATLTVKVYDPFKPTGVKLNKRGTVKLKVGATMRLYCSVTPVTAVTTLSWRTTNANVAAIDGEGLVTAVGKGTCYVGVITDNGKYARVKVKVS